MFTNFLKLSTPKMYVFTCLSAFIHNRQHRDVATHTPTAHPIPAVGLSLVSTEKLLQ